MGYYVYVHTNKINDKKYVGLTTAKPEHRWRSDGSGYVKQPYFFRSITKYGWNNFDHDVYEVDTKEDMYYLEQYLISFYDTMNQDKGYNLSRGGESGNNQMKNSYSKDYDKEYKAQYRQTHKEQIKLHFQEYCKTNQEKVKKRHQDYYQAHKEHIKERVKKYREEHIDQIKESKKRWAEEHKEELKEYHRLWKANRKVKTK